MTSLTGRRRHADQEWLVSIAIGFGAIPLSLLTRFISRNVFGVNVPQDGADRVDMDIGYGAVLRGNEKGKDGSDASSSDGKDSSPLKKGAVEV